MNKEISLLEKIAISTNRKLEYYLAKTNLTAQDLSNKRILNVGAGRTDLQRDLYIHGVTDSKVANIDLAYDPKRLKRLSYERKISQAETPPNAIGGDFKKLPFLDDSFDIAFASWSVSPWIFDPKVQVNVFEEMLRVSREAYVIPFSRSDYKHSYGSMEQPREHKASLLRGSLLGETTLYIARKDK